MRQLNPKCFISLLGLLITLSGSLALVHYLQTGRIARALRAQAQAAEEQGQVAQAVRNLSRYLEFVPRDVEERAHLGRLLARKDVMVTPQGVRRAIRVLEQVLGCDPDRREARLLLVSVALEARNLELAREHLKILRETNPQDPAVEELQGLFHELQGQHAEAIACFRLAVELGPSQIDSHVRLANLLRLHSPPGKREEGRSEADRVMDRLVANNGSSYQAHLARWRYRKTYQDLKKGDQLTKAAEDVSRARDLAGDEPDTLVANAELAVLQGKVSEARVKLMQGLERNPENPALYRTLAELEIQAKRPQEAINCLRQAVKKLPAAFRYEFHWSLTNLLIEGNEEEKTEAKVLIAQLYKSPATLSAADYLQGRWLLAQRQWTEAARLLERARPALENLPELGPQLDLALGQCYQQLGDSARQQAALARLVQRSPDSVPFRLALAASQAAQGQLDQAIQQYQFLLTLPEAPPQGHLELARLLIQRNLQQSLGDWDKVEQALQKVPTDLPQAAEVPLLRAEARAAQNLLDEARQILETACQADQEFKQSRLRLSLALVLDRLGKASQAHRLLEEVASKAGDSADLRVAKAHFWANQRTPEATGSLEQLAQNLERLTPEQDQARVLQAVAEALARLGHLDKAESFWERMAKWPGNENDARLRILLCEVARETKHEKVMQQAVQELYRIEGGQGPAWCYCEALRLLYLAHQGQARDLTRVDALLRQAAAQRAGWLAVVVARGDLAEVQGNLNQAIACYRQARELGERSLRISRRLVEFYYRQQRYEDADKEIKELLRRSPVSLGLQVLAADISLRTQDPTRAVQLALQAMPAESRDYRHHLWLGQLLAASGQKPDQAEKHLRQALQLNNKVPETWVALVHFLASRNRAGEAENLLQEANLRLSPDRLPLALAPCYEALDRSDLAQQQYQAILANRPEEAAVLRGVAGHYLRTLKPQAAEPLLRRLSEGKVPGTEEDVAWARAGLAIVLAARGDHPGFLEALKLVGLQLNGSGPVIEDRQQSGVDTLERRRARAHVLATRPSLILRKQALSWLEELYQQKALGPGDCFLLSQLYEATGDWAKAGQHLRALVGQHGREPLYLVQLALNLLHQGQTEEVGPVLERLVEVEKTRRLQAGALGTVELRARLLEATGGGDKAVALLQDHARRKEARAADLMLPIHSLSRQKRFPEAIALCEEAWSLCPAEILAGPHVGLLRAGGAAGEPCRRVEQQLMAALAANPRSVPLLLALADLHDLRQRFTEAEDCYRRVLQVEPNHLVALNNLAWLLAHRGAKGEEALPFINQALQIYGPRGDLLDTRALVFLSMQQCERARADLEAALRDIPTAPRYFHLGRVLRLANDPAGASAALLKAKSLGLKRSQLHPAELLASASLLDGLD